VNTSENNDGSEQKGYGGKISSKKGKKTLSETQTGLERFVRWKPKHNSKE